MSAAESALVAGCVAGDRLAWERLYARCHRGLLRSIAAVLGNGRDDLQLEEEIAARVWYALAADQARLLRQFDPRRASLGTYLTWIARGELSTYLRSERRRKRRETVAAENEPRVERNLESLEPSLDEFLRTLTPKENEFCRTHLLTKNGSRDGISPANRWQLRHRVYRKLLKFLDSDAVSASR
jgi:RNA polymerase sigma factor (sigma-70 family)